MNIPNLEHIGRGSTFSEKNIKNKFPEFFDVLQQYPTELTFAERLWWFKKGLTSHPICPTCGNPTNFVNANVGYNTYCSKKCSRNDIVYAKISNSLQSIDKSITAAKRKDTCIKRYGVEYATQLDSTKQRKKSTCIRKYGVENTFQSEVLKNKSKMTMIERYGVEHSMQNKNLNAKMHDTMIEKYGVKHAQQRNTNIVDLNTSVDFHKRMCPHPACNKCTEKWYEIKDTVYYDRNEYDIEPCTRLLPQQDTCNKNTGIEQFICNILDNCHITYEQHNRLILDGKELDIFIPELNIAIECNGVYWHSDVNKPHNYHYNKYLECKKLGIQLIQVWEDQVYTKPQIVESIIKSVIHKNDRIYARMCVIKEVSSKDAKIFLQNNHLQGNSTNQQVQYGLFFDSELLSLMTFGRNRYGCGWELIRFCNKCGVNVIGGASRLFKHFVNQYSPSTIISYCSNDISVGNLYNKLGMNKIGETKYSYWYIDKHTFVRYHRQNFTKKALVQAGYDKNLTESEIMNQKDYYRIYDSGQTKFEINF